MLTESEFDVRVRGQMLETVLLLQSLEGQERHDLRTAEQAGL